MAEHLDIKCIDCMNIKLLSKEEKIGQRAEEYGCKPDGTTKTKYCIFAIKQCSRFLPGENDVKGTIEEPGKPFIKCQKCSRLHKINYRQCQGSHHENWDCSGIGFSMQFEDTLALRYCPVPKKGTPKNKAEQKY